MAKRSKASAGEQAKGCGCLVLLALLVVGGCNILTAGRDDHAPTPTVSAPASQSVEDFDADGVEDALDGDDGDGVDWADDTEDQDPDKGKAKPKTTPRPEPEPERESAPIANVHPGGFCGNPGAVGVGANGRTYICRGDHWRP